MRRFLSGLAAGLTLAYAAVRTYDALLDVRDPAPAAPKDARSYGRLRRRLMVASIARSMATAGWVAFAVAPRLRGDDVSAERRGRRLAGIALALIGGSVLDTGTDYVEDFVQERRFGLSKQDARNWLSDRAKALAVTVVIAVPLVEVFVAVVRRAPKAWPVAVIAGTVPLLVLANLIAPTFILPLFNRFEPLRGPTEERLRALARRHGVGDAQILRVDMSRQTEKANAYVTGLFGAHRIVVGDTLLTHFTPDETEFVVAHELGHYVHRDVWRSVALGTGAVALIILLGRALARRSARGGSETAIDALFRLFFFGEVVGVLVGPVVALASRRREWAADRFALTATGRADWGIAAFSRLRDRNLAEDEQPRWMEALFSSHPSMRARIAALEQSRR